MIRNIICYISTIVLLGFYGIIMFKSLDTTNASLEYKMFYVEDKLKYYPDTGELMTFVPGTPIYYQGGGRYHNQGKGWDFPGENATWCYGKDSFFYMYLNDSETNYRFAISIEDTRGFENHLIVNDYDAGVIVFDDGKKYGLVDVKGDYMQLGINEFAIECVDPMNEDGEQNLLVECIALLEMD